MLQCATHGSTLLRMLLLRRALLPAEEAVVLLALDGRCLAAARQRRSSGHLSTRGQQSIAAVRVGAANALDRAVAERAQDRLRRALAHLLTGGRLRCRYTMRLQRTAARLVLGLRTTLEPALQSSLITLRPLRVRRQRLLRVTVPDDHTVVITEHVVAAISFLLCAIFVACERLVLGQAVVDGPDL